MVLNQNFTKIVEVLSAIFQLQAFKIFGERARRASGFSNATLKIQNPRVIHQLPHHDTCQLLHLVRLYSIDLPATPPSHSFTLSSENYGITSQHHAS